MEKQGLIYDPTAKQRIDEFLTKQEAIFTDIDKEQDSKKIIRYGIILGGTILTIVLFKLLTKNKG